VPDFRGRMEIALDILEKTPPHVFNHNLETVPRLYKQARPGADYTWSLELLRRYKERVPSVTTKSGLMLGLGETKEEVMDVMRDMKAHNIDMVTLGQYLQPSRNHLAVARFVHPDEFEELRAFGEQLGFSHVASGPLVRSSYHADKQAKGELI
jgi:lipoic acid synthetase